MTTIISSFISQLEWQNAYLYYNWTLLCDEHPEEFHGRYEWTNIKVFIFDYL